MIGNDRMEAFLSPEGCPESPQIGDSVNQLCDGLYLKYRKPHHEKRKLMNSIQYVVRSSQGNIFLFIALQCTVGSEARADVQARNPPSILAEYYVLF